MLTWRVSWIVDLFEEFFLAGLELKEERGPYAEMIEVLKINIDDDGFNYAAQKLKKIRYDSRNLILDSSLFLIDDSNRTGSMKFVVPPADTSAFFPIYVRFSVASTFSNMKVVGILPVKDGVAPNFGHRTQIFIESYYVV